MDSFTSYCLNRLQIREIDLDLIGAARSGLLEETKRLVSIGADITAANHAAFIHAAGKGHLGVVMYLASAGVDITIHDNSALKRAASNGELDVVRYLVSVGADVTADDNYAVRYAAEGGYVETVKYLISLGADIEVVYEVLCIDPADTGKDELLANLDITLMASSPSEASEVLRRAVEERKNMVNR